jgi:hypothetical protein
MTQRTARDSQKKKGGRSRFVYGLVAFKRL